ncbi:MAG: methionyl-tRNA formyltransferase [Lachnospiraceae bacterium]|nr:methionyl-tRNA formyltransferase [Lachnospiraceae bacterium]
MKLIFMGTPDFTVPILDALYGAGHEIVLVVTQPDKPKGRKAILTAPPAKEWALKNDIPVFQPVRIRDDGAYEELKKYEADAAVVAAFGQILPKRVLDLPAHGCINVHASLLPKYRGAAPIQWSILNGDVITGVTTMQMGEGLDDGDILLQKECVITPEDTGGSLFDKLALLGGEAIVETRFLLEAGKLIRHPQNEALATSVGKIDKSLGHLDFTKSALELERYIRGLAPWPAAYVTFRGKSLKLWAADVITEEEVAEGGLMDFKALSVAPGTTAYVSKSAWIVRAGEGLLALHAVQPEGKKRMSAEEFLRGYKVKVGEAFF